MSPAESFDDVIGRLRAGDQDAAAEVYRRFASRLIDLARSRLDSQVRRKVDPESVAQSVFRSFFLRQAKGQFELDDWDSLWSLLVRITLRKCGRRIAAFHAERRDVRREVASAALDRTSRLEWEAIARDPTPDEAAQLTETLERLMSRLDQKQQQIVTLRLQGYTVREISREIGCTERSVLRKLELVRDGLKRIEAKA
jgi:RNA polymerase sigma-70 factor (ECF subfamily)